MRQAFVDMDPAAARDRAAARILAAALTLAAALGFGSAHAGEPPQFTGHLAAATPSRLLLRMEPAVIVDASGFERPMAASTLFIPSGWRPEGGVFWGQEYACTNGYNFQWAARSPDGLSWVAVLPQERWEWNNYGAAPSSPGCQIWQITSVRQYLEALPARMRPGTALLNYRPRPDLEQEFAALNRAQPMPMGEARTWVEAGELLYGYQDNGRQVQAAVTAVAVFSLMRSNTGMGGGTMDALTAYTFPPWGAGAPAGQLDLRVSEAIRRSLRPDPAWNQRISGHNVAIGRVALEESRKRSEMLMRSNEEIARIRQDAWNASQESADRRAREVGELLRGVETYQDAGAPGGQVELSASYDNAWRLNDGTYVLTNDKRFEPWRELGVEGRRLEAAQ